MEAICNVYIVFTMGRPLCYEVLHKGLPVVKTIYTVDSRYLEFDGTMEKIWVNRSSTQEELRRYRKRGLFNNEKGDNSSKILKS